jgi:4-amino-4-deoxy-L-arabinose transferase-like glycosyltransferase
MIKKTFLISILIFILAFIPRLYKIDNPIADWHSWRQADTASVSRNFIKEGFNPLYPQFDSYFALNADNAGNPNRYFFAEFPLYNILTLPFYQIFGVNEVYARLVSIIASSLAAVFLYLLVRLYSSHRAAILSGVIFAILPYNIYYGRVVMPDPLHIMLGILSLYLVSLWIHKTRKSKAQGKPIEYLYALAAGLAVAAALLTKPYGLILGLPIAYLFLKQWGFKTLKKPSIYLFSLVALVPFMLWRFHINLHPEGMFGTDWLYNAGNIRFTGAFFRWLIFDRMNRLIFATGGFTLFLFGLARGRTQKEGWFYYIWLLGVAIFFVVIAKGNVTHDYYQLPLVPIGSIFIALGIEFLVMYGKGLKHRIANFVIAVSLFLIMIAFGWFEVRGYFNINHWEIVRAGQAADRLLPKDAKVIAPYQSDSAFLYQTNRYGWTVGGGLIPQFIEAGATHLVSTTLDEDTNLWRDRCQTVAVSENNEWIIIDLTQCQEDPQSQEPTEEFSIETPPTQDDVYL